MIMAATAFDVVLKELKERVDMLSTALVNACASDYAEYKHMCGEIRGLSYAQNIINDLVRRLERDEDE